VSAESDKAERPDEFKIDIVDRGKPSWRLFRSVGGAERWRDPCGYFRLPVGWNDSECIEPGANARMRRYGTSIDPIDERLLRVVARTKKAIWLGPRLRS